MKTAVLLVLFGLAVDLSNALLISEDKTQPSEDEDRLNRNSFLHTGSYILRKGLDDNDYEGTEDSSENESNNEVDDVEDLDNEERTFEKSVNDFEMDRGYDNLDKEVSDPFRRPRSRRRRKQRRQNNSRLTSNRRRRQWGLRRH